MKNQSPQVFDKMKQGVGVGAISDQILWEASTDLRRKPRSQPQYVKEFGI